MKTITVTNKMYKQLMSLATEIANQSNRATAKPYFYQIQCKREVLAQEGDGTAIYVDKNGEGEIREEEEIIEVLSDHYYENPDILADLIDIDKENDSDEYREEKAKEAAKQVIDNLDAFDELEKLGYRERWITTEYRYENAFLTEKSIKEHIRRNHYHYNEPTDYLNHAFRNPDMELIFKFLDKLK